MPYSDPNAQKQAQREWYEKNKSITAQRSAEARKRRKEWYKDLMKDKSCTKCGESDIACLDWHHTDPTKKEGSVSFLLSNNSKKMILEEIEKCVCLCSNCHRKLHYYNRV